MIIAGRTKPTRQLGTTKKKDIEKDSKKADKKDDKSTTGVTKVLRIKQSKFIYAFVGIDEHTDMIEFLKTVPVEMRLTVGHSWENHFFTCRGPFMRKLAQTDYRQRGCEDHFSRNFLMFNPNMEYVNLRMTFGASRDFDTDISQIEDL